MCTYILNLSFLYFKPMEWLERSALDLTAILAAKFSLEFPRMQV